MIKFSDNKETDKEEISVLDATEKQLEDFMKTWDFSRTFGYAEGLLQTCKYYHFVKQKQVRIDAALKVLKIAWKKYLKRK